MEAHRNAPRIGDAVYDAKMSMATPDIPAKQDPLHQRVMSWRIRKSY